MLNLLELKKIIKYNYKILFNDLMPRYNKIIISKNSFYNILTGSLLLFIGYYFMMIVLSEIAPLVTKYYYSNFGLSTNHGLGSDRLFLVCLPLFLLFYVIIIKDKKHVGFIYYVYLLINIPLFILFIFRSISFVGVYLLDKEWGIIGFIAWFISLLGYLFTLVGIMDHLMELRNNYLYITRPPKDEENVIKKYQEKMKKKY